MMLFDTTRKTRKRTIKMEGIRYCNYDQNIRINSHHFASFSAAWYPNELICNLAVRVGYVMPSIISKWRQHFVYIIVLHAILCYIRNKTFPMCIMKKSDKNSVRAIERLMIRVEYIYSFTAFPERFWIWQWRSVDRSADTYEWCLCSNYVFNTFW